MTHYLIEFRFQSYRVKKYLKNTIYDINKKFKVGKRKHVPHITLVGPIQTNNEKKLISDFNRICSETGIMKFKMKGFGTFDSNGVVYVDINPNDRFNEFRNSLSKTLGVYCKLKPLDRRKDKNKFGYHSTLAMKLNPDKFKKIKKYINSKPKPNFTQIVMRVTLLKNGKILREYDFMLKRSLIRSQALNRKIRKKSGNLLRKFMEGKYNPNIKKSKSSKKKSRTFFRWIKSLFN